MSLDNILVEAFALARAASTRVAKITPYYVQLLGAQGVRVCKPRLCSDLAPLVLKASARSLALQE
ncbi:MAG: hypothetical protein Q8755_03195, partial [Candidatus Phytoplasma australasiaticum]|nr:hypothetical protein [Candidatus Phytoplasma australasiaticum]